MDAHLIWEGVQALFLLAGSVIKLVAVGVAVLIIRDWLRKPPHDDEDATPPPE